MTPEQRRQMQEKRKKWQNLPPEYRLGVVFGLLTAVAYASYMLTMRAARTGSAYPLPTREVALVSLGSAAILGVSAVVEGASLAIPTNGPG